MSTYRKLLLGHLWIAFTILLAAWLIPPQEATWLKPALLSAVALFALIVAGWWTRAWQSRLRQLTEYTARLESGELGAPEKRAAGARWPDEISQLWQDTDKIRSHLLSIMETLRSASNRAGRTSAALDGLAKKINVSAGKISRSMDEIGRGAEVQTELVDKTSTLIGEVARSIERTSRSAEDAAKSSRDASLVAQSGSQLAGKAVDKMHSVFEAIESYSQRVFGLGERTQEIGNIVRVITEVAQQTHLLAINATIEAARAGDAGRGFAVVAEEIRLLAENTSRSADRIAKIVEEVSAGSQEAIEAVSASSRQLTEGRDQLTAIVDALKNIVTTVTSGSDRVQIISRLAKEQIAGAELTVHAVENISQVTQKNASSTEAVSRAVEAQSATLMEVTDLTKEIVALAQELELQIHRFNREEPDRERNAAGAGNHQPDGSAHPGV